jgi:hypothetical protein
MPDIDLSDEEYKKASEYVDQTKFILDMELRTSQIPIGMFLVGMARFMGHAIQKATSALGPERREEQLKGFFKIIKDNAYSGEHSDAANEE